MYRNTDSHDYSRIKLDCIFHLEKLLAHSFSSFGQILIEYFLTLYVEAYSRPVIINITHLVFLHK